MDIAARSDADMDDLVTLARRVREHDNYPIFEPEKGLAWFFTHPRPIAAWIARVDDTIVGHVALHPSATDNAMRFVAEQHRRSRPAFISRLLVDPDRRGARIGARLLDHARRWAVSSGYGPYLEAVDVPDGAAAIALYRSQGWVEIGRVGFALVDDSTEEIVFAGPVE